MHLKTDKVDFKKRPSWKISYLHLFEILSSSRHEKRCWISERFFCLFQFFTNIRCLWLDDCMKTARRLPDDYLITARQLAYNCLTITWWLSDNLKTISSVGALLPNKLNHQIYQYFFTVRLFYLLWINIDSTIKKSMYVVVKCLTVKSTGKFDG